ncbi:hypothetical protein LRAMOSA10190 [Lichtheimia ramosa]|uniref:Uncharacterized protein n=1 Tax=Lichtheimia ramosa TaxID=688394 RepID=A0A077WP04_9FUNG|nr:hypothetical protein LRAMOSA10190 [Lichtheimia ramosa]
MSSKAQQEYRSAFITLISQLSTIEQKGQEFFDKIEKAAWTPYEPNAAQVDLEQLMSAMHTLETHVKTCGLLSITGTSSEDTDTSQQGRNLATRTAETVRSLDTYFQEKNRLVTNIRAAVSTVDRPI